MKLKIYKVKGKNLEAFFKEALAVKAKIIAMHPNVSGLTIAVRI